MTQTVVAAWLRAHVHRRIAERKACGQYPLCMDTQNSQLSEFEYIHLGQFAKVAAG